MPNFLWQMLKNKWVVPKDTRPSFAGQNVIVTGSNIGLGLEASAKFVELGAKKVILAVRTLSKGEAAKAEIEKRTGKRGVLDVWHLDMMDYGSIKEFADRATRELERLHIACLNAGVSMMDFEKSQYGYERTLQVNVLSTTLLALLLVPKLRASKTATFTPVLEIVGSSNHFLVTKLNSETEPLASYNQPEGYFVFNQYSVSKLFVQYAETALAQLAISRDSGHPDFFVTVVCPGATASELARDATAWYYKVIISIIGLLVQRKTEEGARTYISGVTQGEKLHGRFWKDDVVREEAALIEGEKGKKLQQIVWKEIVDALQKDVPEVKQLAKM